jgi:sugar-specific transcriptional regulator TrmB
MDAKLLQEIGLTEGETKVYLALLRLGESKTGPLAKEAKVSSSKVYKVLDRLMDKGLAGHSIKGKIKYFTAVEPKRILEYMEKKEEEMKEKRSVVEKLIPQLELEQKMAKKPEAVVYDGFKAVTNMIKNIIDEIGKGGEYCVLGATYGDTPGLRPFFYNHHTKRAKKSIKVKMLANFETKGNLEESTMKNAEIRYLPKQFVSNMTTYFYNKKILIVLWTRSPTAFVMESEEAVKSFKAYFDSFWAIAKQ